MPRRPSARGYATGQGPVSRQAAPGSLRGSGVAETSRRRFRPRVDARAYQRTAHRQLQRFRRGGTFAVALVALLLLAWGAPVDGQDTPTPTGTINQPASSPAVPPDPAAGVDEAAATIRDLALGFYGYVPRLVLALVVLALGLAVARIGRLLLERTLQGWERATALAALVRLVTFLAVGIVALSILAGDARAVVGSLGLVGLAASWALQTPIESFTGWLLNSFHGYYRVGDRIAVGDVFGDVYRIDVLTTTVWEAGGPGKAVTAAQATGAIITFPNWEVLRSNIVNYSRDFPYVWDEITISVANESDLAYTARVLEDTARRVLGSEMAEAAERYEQLLRAERLAFGVEAVPQVFLSGNTSWTDAAIRYVVPVRTRRAWASRLLVEVTTELARPEHRGRILNVYPRSEVRLREQWGPEATGPHDV